MLGIRKVICYVASNVLDLGEELPLPKKGKDTRGSPRLLTPPLRMVSTRLPLPSPPSPLPHFLTAPKKRFCRPKQGWGCLRAKASSEPPSLYLSKPQACLIMINCHMDNQIQFQKVGNDIPRTPGKTRDLSLFEGRKGRSLPQPHNLFLF